MRVKHAHAPTQHNSINKTHIKDNIHLTVTELFAEDSWPCPQETVAGSYTELDKYGPEKQNGVSPVLHDLRQYRMR
jgi:hypothetical protein